MGVSRDIAALIPEDARVPGPPWLLQPDDVRSYPQKKAGLDRARLEILASEADTITFEESPSKRDD